MRKPILIVLSCAFLLSVDQAWGGSSDCKPQRLRTPVLMLVKPILELNVAIRNTSFDEHEILRDRMNSYYGLLLKLFQNQSVEADEAISYLLYLHLGSHSGEVLLCEALIWGERLVLHIVRYRSCLPFTGLEQVKNYPSRSENPELVLKWIKRGESCDHSF
jgi:hypothetical protein